MIRSLLLFAHIVGMLTLFAGLGLEVFGLGSSQRRRLYATAFALILLTGVALATRVGVHGLAWVRVSFITMLVIAIAGRFANTIWIRIGLGLAIVYLMISKSVDLDECLVAVGVALIAGLIVSAFRWRRVATATE